QERPGMGRGCVWGWFGWAEGTRYGPWLCVGMVRVDRRDPVWAVVVCGDGSGGQKGPGMGRGCVWGWFGWTGGTRYGPWLCVGMDRVDRRDPVWAVVVCGDGSGGQEGPGMGRGCVWGWFGWTGGTRYGPWLCVGMVRVDRRDPVWDVVVCGDDSGG